MDITNYIALKYPLKFFYLNLVFKNRIGEDALCHKKNYNLYKIQK